MAYEIQSGNISVNWTAFSLDNQNAGTKTMITKAPIYAIGMAAIGFQFRDYSQIKASETIVRQKANRRTSNNCMEPVTCFNIDTPTWRLYPYNYGERSSSHEQMGMVRSSHILVVSFDSTKHTWDHCMPKKPTLYLSDLGGNDSRIGNSYNLIGPRFR